ncbi:MAG TPA: calcium/sodium antiporter [Ilumatobacteraceae bacterium]|nr:calcium/sodium antiporter [Ilumatobacteraceae bacterium]
MSLGTIALLIAGLVALVGGAEFLVRGAARLAARTGMSSVVIGLTVVAFGTSAPELAGRVGDALRGGDEAGAIAIGNVVGSNIANVLLVLGLAAAVGGSLFVAQRIVRLDVPIMIGASVLVLVFVLNEKLERIEGLVLLSALAVYLTWTLIAATRGSSPDIVTEYDEALDPKALAEASVLADIGYLLLGLILLVFGSQALVNSASDIATDLGVSDLVIGLTVVAIGTSLPEVATSVLAAMRGQRDLAVGNAIGSNLFNLLAVLGVTAVVSPNAIPVAASAVQVDIPVMVAVAVACLPLFANGYVLYRWEGIAFLVGYAGYLIWLVLDATEHGSREPYGTAMLYFVVPIVTVTIATLWYRGRADGPAELR